MDVLVESAIRSTLLAVAAIAVLRIMRVPTAAGRHAAWTVVLAGMLTSPLWTVWGPDAPLPLSAPPIRATSSALGAPAAWIRGPVALSKVQESSEPARAVAGVPGPTPVARTIPWRALALGIYAAGVVVLLGRLFVGTMRAQRLIRQAVERAGYPTSNACAAPVTVGWFHPLVILPDGWQSWSGTQLEAVLLHEREHARRRDPLVQWLALLNRAIFWCHPLAWWLERHLARLSEEACDAAVLARGHEPSEYCEYLLSMARAVTSTGARIDIVGAAMPGSFLPQRIRHILKAVPEAPITARRLTWTVTVCVLASVGVMAGTLAAPAAQGARLPDYWFEDDEWHLETAPLMSGQELAAYADIKTTAARDAFVSDFWKRHDPTPATQANEFRREFERRVRYARERYADPESAAIPGYATDRGRWYVMFGHPDAVRVSGRREVNGIVRSAGTEEWDYGSLDELGPNVSVRFDPSAMLGCTYRGGKYRIVSPSAVARFEGMTSGEGRRPFAQTYPGRFVYLSFQIDEQASAMRYGMHTDREGQLVLNEETGPIDYVQGEIGSVSDDPARPAERTRPLKPILAHFEGYRLFEPGGIACTEQLPADTYTLRIETRLMNGTLRADSVTFTVKD